MGSQPHSPPHPSPLFPSIPPPTSSAVCDNPFWGDRLQNLNVGSHVPSRRVDTPQLTRLVERLFSPQVKSACEEMQRRMLQESSFNLSPLITHPSPPSHPPVGSPSHPHTSPPALICSFALTYLPPFKKHTHFPHTLHSDVWLQEEDGTEVLVRELYARLPIEGPIRVCSPPPHRTG